MSRAPTVVPPFLAEKIAAAKSEYHNKDAFDRLHPTNPLNWRLLVTVKAANVLVVGAGGIGCELLKNLVLTGFQKIHVIDLDTIDVSNLNRQFLFQRKHVGKPKALVARESALRLAPTAEIVAEHDTVFNTNYNVSFFKQFDIVLNALDNLAARNHVNRMCMASNLPLVESGSAGYFGQVSVIKKGVSMCYECSPPPRRKTFPGCTIRNTPSELIHCVVWSKYLFNQLFGEEDADKDVSPQVAASAADAGGDAKASERQSMRKWALTQKYDPKVIFKKLFYTDIEYLLSMDKLWRSRKPPVPVSWTDDDVDLSTNFDDVATVQQKLSLTENMALFYQSVEQLGKRVMSSTDGGIGGEVLYWDKDDQAAMDFASSAGNIRAHIFGIDGKTRWDIKSMAGM